MTINITDIPREYTRAVETVGTTWPFEDFVRMHGEYDSVVVADSKKGMLEYGIFRDANGKHIVACISDVVKKYSAEEFEKNKPNLEVVVLDSGTYCVCTKWKDVTLGQQTDIWTDEFGVEYDRKQRALLKVPKDIEKYIVAEGTKTIGNAAFSNCEQLKSVILPDSMTGIGHYAFAGCKSIYSFAIPNRVTKLGNGVFMDCCELSSIRMPAGLSDVEKDIFQGCDNLNSVFVPKGCKYKFDDLLYGHYVSTHEYNPQSKDEIEILDRILHGIVDESGVLYAFEGDILLSATKKIETYCVKPGTIGIRIEAFKPDVWHDDGKSLKRIYLPDSITMIGDAAFANNQALEYVNIPKKAAFFIDDNPFAGCTSLHTIKWETEKAVKEGTLIYNQEQTALIACLPWYYIGGIVKSWSLLDFARQHGKMQVGEFKNKDTGELFKSCIFTRPDDGIRTFVAFCSAMGELTPKEIAAQKNELTVVQLESGNYSLCKGKVIIEQDSQVDVPYGVKTIAAHAFFQNEVLQEITLPATIEAIGKNVFKGCKLLSRIRIPHGTLDKFEKLLPEWKNILVEKYKIVSDSLSDFVLPDGSIYNGGCLRNPFGSVVLDGIGCLTYPNGDKYKGSFKNGRPYGWGIYWFQNGHKYKGYFDEQPKGIGYLNEDYDMTVGNFYEGRLHGWAICYRNRIFKFGYWQNGKLICDETDKTLWVRAEISELRNQYQGNLIQISQGHEFIRFGIPEREIIKTTDMPNAPKWPAMGFEFFKDGTVKVGEIRNNSSGNYILCKVDGTLEFGHWKDSIKDVDKTLADFQRPIDSYEVDGLDVFK